MGDPAIDHEIDLPGRGRTRIRDVPGPAGAPALLLLHGLGATGRLNWGRCYRPLSEHFRVLSLDHRGHGSGVRTRRFRLEDCADDAVHAAEARGVSHFIAVGYSMGGPIASLTWRRHPERVTGLVLCATSRRFVAPQIAAFARATLPFAAATARLVPGRVHSHMLGRMLRGIEHSGMRERVKEELSGHDPATIVHMYTRMQNYVPAEVFEWIDGMSGELVSYEGRMASMTRCALDEPGIREIAATIAAAGLTVQTPDVLSLEETGDPAAWILTARRDN